MLTSNHPIEITETRRAVRGEMGADYVLNKGLVGMIREFDESSWPDVQEAGSLSHPWQNNIIPHFRDWLVRETEDQTVKTALNALRLEEIKSLIDKANSTLRYNDGSKAILPGINLPAKQWVPVSMEPIIEEYGIIASIPTTMQRMLSEIHMHYGNGKTSSQIENLLSHNHTGQSSLFIRYPQPNTKVVCAGMNPSLRCLSAATLTYALRLTRRSEIISMLNADGSPKALGALGQEYDRLIEK